MNGITDAFNFSYIRNTMCASVFPFIRFMKRPKSVSILDTIFGPRQANLVLIAYASSEGSGEPAHPSSASRGTFRRKARSLNPLNGWACAVKICHDGMLEDTNLLDTIFEMKKTFEWQKVVYLYDLKHDKTNKITSAPNEDSDQTGHPPSLIRVFTVHFMNR